MDPAFGEQPLRRVENRVPRLTPRFGGVLLVAIVITSLRHQVIS